jgi:hypothetical protein
MASQKRYIVWIDAGGRTTATIPCAQPDNSAIMAALENHSNAGVLDWFEGPDNPLTPTALSAIFPDVRDLARLTFTDAGGSLATIALPAPQDAIFLPDSVTVDPSAIADIITACVGSLCTAGGGLVTAYVAGVRNQRSSGS